ncbi:MAG: chemotaxis protein CheX [Gemmatimonadales bacterium]|nr:chemotaxis protein CheX [Gemmatimonadales bacterium]
MSTLTRERRIEDPEDVMSKLDGLKDAVDSLIQTFEVQFGMKLVPVGMPGRPHTDNVLFGSSVALTNDDISFQFACTFDQHTAEELTRVLFDMEPDEQPTMEDMGDALNEIPNVAAGVWKAKREKLDEHFQLGLPLFLKGSAWIQYFPRGINAISQRMEGPDGIIMQVALIWRYAEQAGGIQAMTNQTAEQSQSTDHSVPMQVLKEAVQAVVDTCRIQMELELEVNPTPSDPREADVEYGSGIALTAENGGWQLAVMGSKNGCQILTRSLFAMEDDEEPEMVDMADAMGEIANVAAGVLKSSRAAAGQKVQLGLPLFMEGRGCLDFFASGLQGMAQTVVGAGGLDFHVILIWQE